MFIRLISLARLCINQLQKKFNKRNRKQTIRGKNQHAISRISKEVLLGNIKKRDIYGMTANGTTVHEGPKDKNLNSYI